MLVSIVLHSTYASDYFVYRIPKILIGAIKELFYHLLELSHLLKSKKLNDLGSFKRPLDERIRIESIAVH